MSRSVIVIGGGILGQCTALFAARRGLRVTVIDREPANAEHCVLGSAGMIVPSHFIPMAAPGVVKQGLKWMWNPSSPFRVKPRRSWDLLTWAWFFNLAANRDHVRHAAPLLRDLHLASRRLFEELEVTPGVDFGLTRNGLLMLCASAHALEEETAVAAEANRLGVPARVLDAAETAALDPNVKMQVSGSIYFPLDCHVDPARFSEAVVGEAKTQGVEFLTSTEALSWRAERRRIAAVMTTAGELSADEFVVVGGAWSSDLVRSLKIRLPMQAGKGYSLTLEAPRERPRICAILTEARVAVTPLPGGRLRFGGTMELVGLDRGIDLRRVRGIIDAVPLYYPNFSARDFDEVKPWSGLRPCSADGLPYLGRFRDFDNLSCGTGHGMLGLSLGPVSGWLLAQVLAGERPDIDIRALAPDRYA